MHAVTFLESFDITGSNNHFYEVIRQGASVKIFMDLDCYSAFNPNLNPNLAIEKRLSKENPPKDTDVQPGLEKNTPN